METRSRSCVRVALVAAGMPLVAGAMGWCRPLGAATQAGHCLAFDGVNDFVRVPRTAALEPSEITVELWARLDGPQDWNTRLLRKGEHDAYFIAADQDHDERMQLLVTRGTDFRVQAKDPAPHTAYAGAWHHFAGVYTTARAEFWVDGARVADVAHDLGALTHLPLTDLYVGAGLPVALQNEYFAGRIDEVRIWSRARTADEIRSTWNVASWGDEPGLVAYWKFDEGGGQVAQDSSPLGHAGELGDSPAAESSDPTWVASDVPLLPPPCAAERTCTSTPNSSGHAAWMGFRGSTSLADHDAQIEVFDAPPGQFGMFFYGRPASGVPFADGYLCVSPFDPGLVRLPPGVSLDSNGHASRRLDWSAPPASEHFVAGSLWHFQIWFRDELPGGAGSNLSDALALRFCP